MITVMVASTLINIALFLYAISVKSYANELKNEILEIYNTINND